MCRTEWLDDLHDRVVAGFSSSLEPWDTFFGARYAIVCYADAHRIGLKGPTPVTTCDPIATSERRSTAFLRGLKCSLLTHRG